jgi:hypothetical protein
LAGRPVRETPEDALAALLEEQRQRWQRGDRVPVETLLEKLPDPAGLSA